MKTLAFEIEVFDVVHGRVSRHQSVFILQQRVDFVRLFQEGGIFFEIGIFIRQNQPLLPLAVGEVKTALRIDKDIFLFQNIKLFIRQALPKGANFRHRLGYHRTFDIKE